MAATKKASAAAKQTESAQLTWRLSELPSSQHKTGLVGLALLVRWLEKKPKRFGVARLVSLEAGEATFEFDERGLRWVFDEAYAAVELEQERDAPFKNKAPLRVVQRKMVDQKKVDKKTGKPVQKTVEKYVYAIVQPRGAFLAEVDPEGNDGAWVKLWRDFVWSVLRAVPATRAPYEARAAKEVASDAADAWTALTRSEERSVDLPSTYFVGAQAANAENVAFRDRERLQFLLHFWPFAVGIGVPSAIDREGKTHFVGHTLAFPDVSDLLTYCEEYEELLNARSPDRAAYLPRQAVFDVPAEGGLQLLEGLRARLNTSESKKKRVADLVLGVDVFHLEREGNNVRTRSTMRIEPSELVMDEYERLRAQFKDPVFRRQVLFNLLQGRDWTAGFAKLFATLPAAHFLRGRQEPDVYPSQFPNDVKKQFSHVSGGAHV